MNLQTLNLQIRSCTKCKLSHTRKFTLPGEGPFSARMMLIAQSPGKVEDEKNKMFVGPSGKIFDELLEQSGVSREEFYLTNLIKCMLPNSRRPSHDEIKLCSQYLEKEIELIGPKVIVPLGFHSTRYIFMKYNISRPPKDEYHLLFGKIFTSGDLIIYPVRHPTALLFNPDKRDVMQKHYRRLKRFTGPGT